MHCIISFKVSGIGGFPIRFVRVRFFVGSHYYKVNHRFSNLDEFSALHGCVFFGILVTIKSFGCVRFESFHIGRVV